MDMNGVCIHCGKKMKWIGKIWLCCEHCGKLQMWPVNVDDRKEDKDGNELMVGAQTVICALGQRGRTDVVEALRNGAPFVRVIGDARKVSTITNAVYQGYHAALDI